jgi:hypothetical protein
MDNAYTAYAAACAANDFQLTKPKPMTNEKKLQLLLEIISGHKNIIKQGIRDGQETMPSLKFVTIATRLEKIIKAK